MDMPCHGQHALDMAPSYYMECVGLSVTYAIWRLCC